MIGIDATKDYDLFVFDSTNRPLIKGKVERLKKSIERHDLLREFPIVVSGDNGGSFTVLDGQHRLEAAKELDLPIFYITTNKMVIADVPMVNGERNNWTAKDFIFHYARKGIRDYIVFEKFMETYKFPLTACLYLLTNGNKGDLNPTKGGSFKVKTLGNATEIADRILEFRKHIDFFRGRSFVIAMHHLINNCEGYDHARMMDRMEKDSVSFKRCPDKESYLRHIEEFYNKGLRKKVRFF